MAESDTRECMGGRTIGKENKAKKKEPDTQSGALLVTQRPLFSGSQNK